MVSVNASDLVADHTVTISREVLRRVRANRDVLGLNRYTDSWLLDQCEAVCQDLADWLDHEDERLILHRYGKARPERWRVDVPFSEIATVADVFRECSTEYVIEHCRADSKEAVSASIELFILKALEAMNAACGDSAKLWSR